MSISLFDLLVREIGVGSRSGRLRTRKPEGFRALAELNRGAASERRWPGTDRGIGRGGEPIGTVRRVGEAAVAGPQSRPSAARPFRERFCRTPRTERVSGPEGAFEDLGRDLANFLIGNYLINWHPVQGGMAALLTLLEPADEIGPSLPVVVDSRLVREPFFVDRFRFERIVDLLQRYRPPRFALNTAPAS